MFEITVKHQGYGFLEQQSEKREKIYTIYYCHSYNYYCYYSIFDHFKQILPYNLLHLSIAEVHEALYVVFVSVEGVQTLPGTVLYQFVLL